MMPMLWIIEEHFSKTHSVQCLLLGLSEYSVQCLLLGLSEFWKSAPQFWRLFKHSAQQ